MLDKLNKRFCKKQIPAAPIKIKIINNFNCCCKDIPLKAKYVVKLIKISIKPKRKEIIMDPIIILMLTTDEAEQKLRYYAADQITPKLVENPHFEELPDKAHASVVNVGTFEEEVNGQMVQGTEATILSFVDNDAPEGDYEIRFEADPKPGQPEGELNYLFTMRVGTEAATVKQNSVTVRPKTT